MSYWETRQEQAYKAGELTVNEYFRSLEKAFNTAKRKLRQAISDFYTEYAGENGLSYADAQKALNKAEIGELKDFIDLAMKNIGKVNQEVNNMSIKARVTRYEALESQIDALLRELYAIDYESKAKESMRTIYRDSYYRTWYNIDKYNGFHKEFAQVQPRVIDQLIQYPFNGKNFSDRLWKQKDHLQEQLMESVTTMLVQERPPQNLASEFAKKLDAKKMDAYRLLHTESSYLMSEATHAGYQEDGVERYQILATLDSKTCGVCGKLDGKIYPVSEAVTGKNKPPFHPFCRCTDVPYYPDMPAEGRTRTARDENGKNIEIPADTSYEEWKEKYLKAKAEASSDTQGTDYMSSSFRPKYGTATTIKAGKNELVVRPVTNIEFNLVTDVTSRRDKAVRLAESLISEAKKKLPSGFELPRVAVVNFEKHGLNTAAIGGYDKETGIMYLNSKYNTREKILEYVNRIPGQFANTTEVAPILHELGHKYYYDSIERLAKVEKLTYNTVKKIVDAKLMAYIDSENGGKIVKELSQYANTGYVSGNYSEVCAEAFGADATNTFARKVMGILEAESYDVTDE